nr:immunoglobulin heavy chain junction region [Mus musculus]
CARAGDYDYFDYW